MLAVIANLLSIFSWVPQIHRIHKTHDVNGFSLFGYMLFIIGMTILLFHATWLKDWVFIAFTACNMVLCVIEVIMIFWIKSRKRSGKE